MAWPNACGVERAGSCLLWYFYELLKISVVSSGKTVEYCKYSWGYLEMQMTERYWLGRKLLLLSLLQSRLRWFKMEQNFTHSVSRILSSTTSK